MSDGAMRVASPPSLGIQMMSSAAPIPNGPELERNSRAKPMSATIRWPSGDHAGSTYSPPCSVSRWALRPLDRMRQMCPAFPSHVVNAIQRPSGDHVGKWTEMSSGPICRGLEPSASLTYSRSRAVKASMEPSGEGFTSRICRTVKAGSSLTG